MKFRIFSVVGLTVLLFVIVFGAQPAAAQTTHCTEITSVPYTIANPGVYCLTNNVTTSGTAIAIAASNVVLDLNGHTIGQTGGTANTETAIFANSQKNITVRNGTVRNFYVGISLYDTSPYTTSSGYVVEDMRVSASTYKGIEIYGLGSLARNNQVFKTGGSTYSGFNGSSFGISVTGLGAEVSDNLIVNTFGTNSGSGKAISLNGDQNLAIHNHIVDATTAVYCYIGTSQYRDNVSSSITGNKNVGCIDIGNNW